MRKRLRSHEGANAVEFALVLPILLMLIYGAITAGLTLNAKQQLDHAAREGARYAATLPHEADACDNGGGPMPWEECVRDRVLATAVGSLNLTLGGVCVTFVDDTNAAESDYYGTIENDNGNTNDDEPCLNENPPLSGERVQVKLVMPGRVDAVLVRTGIFDLTSRSISRYEVVEEP